MQSFLQQSTNGLSILDAYEWEREARKQEWYQEIHNQWIDRFREIIESIFLDKKAHFEKNPHLYYLKPTGFEEFEFLNFYKFAEGKVNFSESWFRKNYPKKYQEIFAIEDDGTIGLPPVLPSFVEEEPSAANGNGNISQIFQSHYALFKTVHSPINNNRMKLEKIYGFYKNPSTSEERRTELLERYPSISNLLKNHRGVDEFPLDVKTLPTLDSFINFFLESYQTAVESNNFSSVKKIFRIKKYANYIENLKKYNPYSYTNYDPILTDKIERYKYCYIQLFYESDSLDTIMHCITSKHVSIDMIEEHFDDIIRFYLKSRERIFDNPHVNIEIYRRWTLRIKSMDLGLFSGEPEISTPMNLSFEIYNEFIQTHPVMLVEFLTLDIERVYWMNRQYQIHFVQSYFPESLVKHKLIEYL